MYNKTEKGNGFQFDVTPAPKVMGGCSGILFIFLMAFLAGMLLSTVNTLVATVASIGVLAWGFLKMDMRKKNHRRPSSFFVSSDKIEVDGQSISASAIHRLIIRNAYDKNPKIQLTGQTVPTGVGIGYDIRNMLEQISYSVDVESGGRATQLAGGMDEVTANGLFTDVSHILGLRS